MLKSHKKTILETLGRNPIHPFPARMAPGIALDALGKNGQPLKVLDPMVGSGTVLAVARANGHHTTGTDLDPLAVLLASVWTRTIDPKAVLGHAEAILAAAQKEFKALSVGDAYPAASDRETREFIRYWFDPFTRRQLTALSRGIERVKDKKVRDVLWCGFSRLIITKKSGASLAMDLSHSRPHKQFTKAPIKPFDKFLQAVTTVVSNCPQLGQDKVGPASNVKRGDARHLRIPSASIDLVLTSPPYLNAIDYMRCSKFSLVWMGYNTSEIRRIRGESVGAESASTEASENEWVAETITALKLKPALSKRDYALLARYTLDMSKALSETTRVLKTGGRAVYVVGDSMSRGTFISNSRIVTAAALRHGLKFISRQSRELPANRRYMPPPKKGLAGPTMDGRMRKEVVVVFQKTKRTSALT